MAATDIIHTRDINSLMIGVVTDNGTNYFSPAADREYVKGIAELSVEVEYDTDESYGEGKVLDKYSKALKVVGSAKAVQVSMKLYAKLTGGDYEADANVAEASIPDGAICPNFFLDGQFLYQGAGDAGGPGDYHIVAYKNKIMKLATTFQRGYAEMSFDFEGIFPLAPVNPSAGTPKSKLVSLFKNITATAAVGSVIPTAAV